jgi:hypothetical protein
MLATWSCYRPRPADCQGATPTHSDNLLSQMASDWSHVEHTLDTIIWQLAGVDAEAAVCILSQISGAYNWYKAIVALLILHERNRKRKRRS